MIRIPRALVAILIGAALLPAASNAAEPGDVQRLLDLHLQVLDAHLERDVDKLLASEAADSVVANRGTIHFPSLEDRRERLGGYLDATEFQTYREGRFKSYRQRRNGSLRLVDLEADPGETRDVAALHPQVVSEHSERMQELTQVLAAPDAAPTRLSEEDRRRLRSLGYLE